MMEFIKTINKYVILLIVSSLFGMPWFYIRYLIFLHYPPNTIVDSIPNLVDYLIRIVIIILLIIDFKKENLKNVVITCIAALFFPLLGIIVFSILLMEKKIERNNG